MRATGIVRQIDELGRVVLPIELRRSFDLKEHDRVEISVEEDRIILKKFEPNCVLCGGTKDLTEFRGKPLCRKCVRDISGLK